MANNSALLSPGWATLEKRFGNFSAGVRLEALVDQLAEEWVLTVQEQLDLLIYNAPPPPSVDNMPKYKMRGGRSRRTRNAVRWEPHGEFGGIVGGLEIGVGTNAYIATVHVDPEEFKGMAFYPYFVDRGIGQPAKPFWRNADVIMQVKRRAIQNQAYLDLKVRLRSG